MLKLYVRKRYQMELTDEQKQIRKENYNRIKLRRSIMNEGNLVPNDQQNPNELKNKLEMHK
ncbi:hypothetical protein AGMMS49592_3680 [Endomicrobiia bacterium]|nr:hypothetical protein AGMMS49592_3680 [Endomicrobiia bacterium]